MRYLTILVLTGIFIAPMTRLSAQTEGEVFVVVEEPPTFPGGEKALKDFIMEELKYPPLAIREDISGKVYVSFIVEKDGSISNVKVLRDIGGGCGEEAVKVVMSMPKWNPGRQRNIPVRVSMNLPIEFKLAHSPAPAQTPPPPADTTRSGEQFVIVETMPEFPGGEIALTEFIFDNIQYPQEAIEQGIQGKVFVAFIVEPDGSISNVRIMKDIGGGCGKEAERIVKMMPRWKPATQKGKAVRVQMTLPVSFQLSAKRAKKK